tara:strand:+ start:168 stop:452 length:285 start_codon:yes stop_codon:yes gene_type:complete
MKRFFGVLTLFGILISSQVIEAHEPFDYDCHEKNCFVCPCKIDESYLLPNNKSDFVLLVKKIKFSADYIMFKATSKMFCSIRAPPLKRIFHQNV